MVTQYYEIEIAYRREQMLADRHRAGVSRRELRRRRAAEQVALEVAEQPAGRSADPEPARQFATG
jgi:hypothetical protein